MAKKKLPRNVVQGTNETRIVPLTAIHQQIAGLSTERKTLYVALKYYQRDFECFSEWGPSELRQFSALNDKLRDLSITQLFAHTGLAPKTHKQNPSVAIPADLRPYLEQVNFTELRVSQVARIHGFFVDPIFFLVWLDRRHRVFPG